MINRKIHPFFFFMFFSSVVFMGIAIYTFSPKDLIFYFAPQATITNKLGVLGAYISGMVLFFYGQVSWVLVAGLFLIAFDILLSQGLKRLIFRIVLLQYLIVVGAILLSFYTKHLSYHNVGIIGSLANIFLLKYLAKEYWTVFFAMLFLFGLIRFIKTSSVYAMFIKNISSNRDCQESGLQAFTPMWPSDNIPIISDDVFSSHEISINGQSTTLYSRPCRSVIESVYKFHNQDYDVFRNFVPDFLQEIGETECRDIPLFFSKNRRYENNIEDVAEEVRPVSNTDPFLSPDVVEAIDLERTLIDTEVDRFDELASSDPLYLKNKTKEMRDFNPQINGIEGENTVGDVSHLSFSEGFVEFTDADKVVLDNDSSITDSAHYNNDQTMDVHEENEALDNVLILEELQQAILELQKEEIGITEQMGNSANVKVDNELDTLTHEIIDTDLDPMISADSTTTFQHSNEDSLDDTQSDDDIDNIALFTEDIISQYDHHSGENNDITRDIQHEIVPIVENHDEEGQAIDPIDNSFTTIDVSQEMSVQSNPDWEIENITLPHIDDLSLNTQDIDHEKEQYDIEETMKMIEDTYQSFNINVQVVDYSRGPTITRFEISPPSGLKLRTIFNLQDDLALQAGTPHIRIVSPLEGRSVIGIEIPNKIRRSFLLREQIDSESFQDTKAILPLILGADVGGETLVMDLSTTPHLLVAGTTGSGKSVYINALIMGLLYKKSFRDLRFIMIDPKMVELELYAGIPHLLAPIITNPEEALVALDWLVREMDRRYKILSDLGVRNLMEYQNLVATDKTKEYEWLPYIVVIVDEFANLMVRAPKDTEKHIARLASMSRAVGIHMVLATQRPSVDVVTGVIKANFPSRIALRVSSKVDSRTIIDKNGAEALLGRGDMLVMSPEYPNVLRIQAPYVSNDDIKAVVSKLKHNQSPDYAIDFSEILQKTKNNAVFDTVDSSSPMDPLFGEVLEFAVDQGEISASSIQRRFRVGYNRASRMIEVMKERDIITAPKSAGKGSTVNISREEISVFLQNEER